MDTSSQRHEDRIVTTVRISIEEVSVRETPYGAVLDAPDLSVTGQPGAPRFRARGSESPPRPTPGRGSSGTGPPPRFAALAAMGEDPTAVAASDRRPDRGVLQATPSSLTVSDLRDGSQALIA